MRWKLVPVEPTEEMVAESLRWCIQNGHLINPRSTNPLRIAFSRKKHVGRYTAMLAAAPPASQDEELVEKAREVISAVLLEYGDEYSFAKAARAVLKMLEADHG